MGEVVHIASVPGEEKLRVVLRYDEEARVRDLYEGNDSFCLIPLDDEGRSWDIDTREAEMSAESRAHLAAIRTLIDAGAETSKNEVSISVLRYFQYQRWPALITGLTAGRSWCGMWLAWLDPRDYPHPDKALETMVRLVQNHLDGEVYGLSVEKLHTYIEARTGRTIARWETEEDQEVWGVLLSEGDMITDETVLGLAREMFALEIEADSAS